MPDVAGLRANANLTVYDIMVTQVRHVGFTLFREPVNDVRVRRAIAHAIDRQAIVDGILLGVGGREAPTMIIPQMPWSISEETEGYLFDVPRAKALLAEAGWADTNGDGILDKNGNPFRIRLLLSSVAPSGIPISEAIQSMLKDVGIDVQLVALERAAFWTAADAGEHEMILIHNVIASATGEIILRRAHSRDASNRIAPVFYMGPEMDALIDRATSTFDLEDRYELYRQIQWQFHEQAVSVPINYMIAHDASGVHVKGYVPHNSGWSQRYDGVYIERGR